MPKKNFFEVNDAYTEKFYQLPQWIFNDQYADLSNNARVAYSLLKDRNSYSVANHWFDEENHIYFIYTNKELADMLKISDRTVTSVKKELVRHNLLFIKKMGYDNKRKMNQPSRLYLLKPILSAIDVYAKLAKKGQKPASTLQQSGPANIASPTQPTSTLQQSGPANIASPKNEVSALERNGSAKFAPYQDKTIDYIDDDDYLISIFKKFKANKKPMIYKGEMAKKQALTLKYLTEKVKDTTKIDKIVAKIIDNTTVTDAPAYLIKALQNLLEEQNKPKKAKSNKIRIIYPTLRKKRVEKATDFDKKFAEQEKRRQQKQQEYDAIHGAGAWGRKQDKDYQDSIKFIKEFEKKNHMN